MAGRGAVDAPLIDHHQRLAQWLTKSSNSI